MMIILKFIHNFLETVKQCENISHFELTLAYNFGFTFTD